MQLCRLLFTKFTNTHQSWRRKPCSRKQLSQHQRCSWQDDQQGWWCWQQRWRQDLAILHLQDSFPSGRVQALQVWWGRGWVWQCDASLSGQHVPDCGVWWRCCSPRWGTFIQVHRCLPRAFSQHWRTSVGTVLQGDKNYRCSLITLRAKFALCYIDVHMFIIAYLQRTRNA